MICDLAVDPYLLDVEPRVVRGIEGIPQGNLDQWEFAPDDPAWDRLPPGIPTGERRTVVSCYSWPGVRPEPCMHVYGSQLAPLLEALVTAGGLEGIRPDGSFHEQALRRGSLRRWLERLGRWRRPRRKHRRSGLKAGGDTGCRPGLIRGGRRAVRRMKSGYSDRRGGPARRHRLSYDCAGWSASRRPGARTQGSRFSLGRRASLPRSSSSPSSRRASRSTAWVPANARRPGLARLPRRARLRAVLWR